jgi:hypothetical protein
METAHWLGDHILMPVPTYPQHHKLELLRLDHRIQILVGIANLQIDAPLVDFYSLTGPPRLNKAIHTGLIITVQPCMAVK